MWKVLTGGLIVLSLALTPAARAQQTVASTDAAKRWAPSAEDTAAFSDARIAALKAGLKLKPEQEKNWTPMETALRDFAKQRSDRLAQRLGAAPASNPVEVLRSRADSMNASAAALKRLADAAEPLYKSLDDGQKQRMFVLMTGMRPQK
jgi:zinc resistance-associated protein